MSICPLIQPAVYRLHHIENMGKLLTAAVMDFHFAPPAFPTFKFSMQESKKYHNLKLDRYPLSIVKRKDKPGNYLQQKQPSH